MFRRFIPALLLLPLLFAACGKTTNCIDYSQVDPGIICTNDYNPVCGCDDITYRNKCYAEKNGVVSYVGGPCP